MSSWSARSTRRRRRIASTAIVVVVGIFSQIAGASVAARAAGAGRDTVNPQQDTDPLQPPQGDVIVDQSGDRLVFRDPATGQTTARVFGSQVAYLDQAGAWKPLNNTLVGAPAGGYVNASGPVRIGFATSGEASKLVQLTSGDNSVSFGLAGAVASEATVNGAAIAYPGVVSRTDLSYQVGVGELKETLAVNQPPPGSGAVHYDFPLNLHGLSPVTAKDGTIHLVDGGGRVDFSLPAGVAVDSAPSDDGPARSTVAVSLAGDAQTGWSIEIQPDADWMRAPDRVYPVYVDPSYTWTAGMGATGSNGYDAYVSSTAPNANFDGSGQYNGTYYVDEASSSTSVRSTDAYYDLSWLSGRSVSAAAWYGYVVNGTTFPSGYQIQPLSGSWSETTVTWNTQPGTISGASVTGSASAVNTWASSSITTWVQNWAGGTWTNNGIVISHNGSGTNLRFAADESSSNLSYIQVTYDSYPTTPTMRMPAGSTATNDVTPELSARMKDTDGGSVSGDFEIWSASTGGTLLYSGSGSTTSSGDRSSWTTPTLANGTTYWWDVRGDDGSLQSSYTTRRNLTIDTAAPTTPGVSSSTYTSGTWSGSTSGSFTFTNGGSTDVIGYYYEFENQNPTANNTTSGSVTISAPAGWRELDVRSYDSAGNLSPLTTFTYGVTPGSVDGIPAGARTQNRVTFSADASTTYDGFRLQYRRADSDTWAQVPAGDVTYQSSGVGISSWPVSLTGSPRRTSLNLVWAAGTTLGSIDGPVQVRARYYISGTAQNVYSDKQTFALDTNAFEGNSIASLPVGPAAVNPVTGNFALTAIDAMAGNLGIQRVFESRSPSTPGFFGPGWASSLLPIPYASLTDNSDTVAIVGSSGALMDFSLNSSGTAYLPEADAAGSSLTKPTSSRFELIDRQGNRTGFQIPSGGSVYVPFDLTTPATGLSATTVSWQTSSGVERPTMIVAPSAPGVSCGTFAAGCRKLTFTYASSTTATGTSSSQWGDYVGRIKNAEYKAWDTELPTPGFTTDSVAKYLYDSNGMLRAAWDGRITPSLKTTYGYDANGEVSTLTQPGMNSWTFTYATISGDSNPGRLSTVQRTTASSGTAITTVIYRVPISGTGAPFDLAGSEITRWAQEDSPTAATAVFPPDEVPSSNPPTDYDRATVYYEDSSGRLVNHADPSPSSCATNSGDCYITTMEYDSFGNIARTLSAGNRQRALNARSADNPDDEAILAARLSITNSYSTDGTELADQYGPAHDVTQPAPNDDQITEARQHTHYDYDQSAPGSANCPCHLATTVTESASPVDGSGDVDSRATTYAYSIGTDNTGWTLRQPLLTTVDPSGLDLVTTTLHDSTTGLPSERRLPAGPTGGDAHSTLFIYYTAGTNSQVSACGNKPEYALLLCVQEPAAQPGTSGLPDMPIVTYSAYNRFDLPLVATATSGSDTRTTTYTYDSGFREQTQATSSTVGTAIPTLTWSYSSTTGAQTTISDGTRSITRAYAGDGSLSSYQDADGNTSTFSYNVDGMPTSLYDGKATQSLTYDSSVDPRGLPTSITDSGIGTFSSTHDADGKLLTQTYPGGLVATRTYDSTEAATHLDYSMSGSVWLAFDSLQSIHGQQSVNAGSLSTTDLSYDAAGRLVSSEDTVGAAGCVTRLYGFDSDSNRTSTSAYVPALSGSCATSSGTTQTRTFDAADRATYAGYSYDALGNATTIPAADSPTALTATAGYFANSMINALTVAGDTHTFQLDPSSRIRTWNDSVDGITRTNHYALDADYPAWTTTNNAGTAWTRNVGGYTGLGAIVTHPASGAETVKLQLVNLHKDVVATADPGGSSYDTPTLLTDEYGQQGSLSATAQYTYLGADARSRDALTGMTLMGSRLYNPAQGRFEQTDPVLGGSANSYGYTSGDPVNTSDPSGQRPSGTWHFSCGIVTCSFYFGIATTHIMAEWIEAIGSEFAALIGLSSILYLAASIELAVGAILVVALIGGLIVALAYFAAVTLWSSAHNECVALRMTRFVYFPLYWFSSSNNSYCPSG